MNFESEHLARHQDILPVDACNVPITIVGAGAMGSNICLMLAKMGFEDITVYDHDKVDTVNLSCQLYRWQDLDKSKVAALAEIIKDFANVDIKSFARKWTPDDKVNGILIGAVDNMDTRGQLFDAHRLYPACQLYIDPRMGAEEAFLLAICPTDSADKELWEQNYYTSDQVEPAACTAKATYYTAGMLSGLAVKSLKDYVTKADKPLRQAQWAINDNELYAWTK